VLGKLSFFYKLLVINFIRITHKQLEINIHQLVPVKITNSVNTHDENTLLLL